MNSNQTNISWTDDQVRMLEDLMDLSDPLWRSKHKGSITKALKAYLLDAHRVCVEDVKKAVVQ